MNYGILSLNIYQKDNNWGSVLQSWALQQVVNDFGFDNIIVNYKPQLLSLNTAKYPILYAFPFHLKRFVSMGLLDIREAKAYYERAKKFQIFIEKHYKLSKKCNRKTIGKLNIDGFIVGSDIVWNEHFWQGIEPAFFCELEGMREKYNIAYAPSMSLDGFSKNIESELPRLLKNFNFISVREMSKKEYVQKFTDKEVCAVLDPTLLLDCNRYNDLIESPLLTDKYVLVYCVGQSKNLIKYALDYAKKINAKLVRLKCVPEKEMEIKGTQKFDSAGIEEWLSLIKYAEMIFTTSFHACIFSIIFKKEFYAVYTPFGQEKIKNLLDSLGLSNYCQENSDYCYNGEVIDYNKVYNILTIKKENSLNFLKQYLSKKGK